MHSETKSRTVETEMQEALAGFYSFTNFEARRAAKYNSKNFSKTSITLLLKKLGNPQNAFPSIHVAGTKGKGSVVSMLSAATEAMGIKTGEYLSPHVLYENERFRIAGNVVASEVLLPHLRRTLVVTRALEKESQALQARAAQNAKVFSNGEENIFSPTLFDLFTASAMLLFKEERVNLAIVETGLGGRLDSTNVLSPLLSVITRIDFDHCDKLGNSLAEIANEKAGIIKRNTPVVYACHQQETSSVIANKARKMSALAVPVVKNSELEFFLRKKTHLRNKKSLATGTLENVAQPKFVEIFLKALSAYYALNSREKCGIGDEYIEKESPFGRSYATPIWHHENLTLVFAALATLYARISPKGGLEENNSEFEDEEIDGNKEGARCISLRKKNLQLSRVAKKKVDLQLEKNLQVFFHPKKSHRVERKRSAEKGIQKNSHSRSRVDLPLFLQKVAEPISLYGRYTLFRNFLLDGAHTVLSLRALVKSVESDERFKRYNKVVCVFFALADKNIEKMVECIPTSWETVFFNPELFYLPPGYEKVAQRRAQKARMAKFRKWTILRKIFIDFWSAGENVTTRRSAYFIKHIWTRFKKNWNNLQFPKLSEMQQVNSLAQLAVCCQAKNCCLTKCKSTPGANSKKIEDPLKSSKKNTRGQIFDSVENKGWELKMLKLASVANTGVREIKIIEGCQSNTLFVCTGSFKHLRPLSLQLWEAFYNEKK